METNARLQVQLIQRKTDNLNTQDQYERYAKHYSVSYSLKHITFIS